MLVEIHLLYAYGNALAVCSWKSTCCMLVECPCSMLKGESGVTGPCFDSGQPRWEDWGPSHAGSTRVHAAACGTKSIAGQLPVRLQRATRLEESSLHVCPKG
eukprot:350984-Chlamydomonas_euryale.AAC.5